MSRCVGSWRENKLIVDLSLQKYTVVCNVASLVHFVCAHDQAFMKTLCLSKNY